MTKVYEIMENGDKVYATDSLKVRAICIIKKTINEYIGGILNGVCDNGIGEEEGQYTIESLKNDFTDDGYINRLTEDEVKKGGFFRQKEVRFLGNEWINRQIAWRVTKEITKAKEEIAREYGVAI